MSDTPDKSPYAETFIFLRTRAPLEFSDDVFDALYYEAPFDQCDLAELKDGETWTDGTLLRSWIGCAPYDIARDCAGALTHFADWAIYQPGADPIDATPHGHMARFFANRPAWAASAYPSLLLLMGTEGDARYQTAAANIERALNDELKRLHCRRVFEWRDGHAFFVIAEEPARTTAQRIAPHTRHVDDWAFVAGREVLTAGGPRQALWADTSLYELRFGDEQTRRDEEDDDEEGAEVQEPEKA
jgi:hypothetical protein